MGASHGTKDVIVHQPCFVDQTAFIGARSIVWYFASVGYGCRIAEEVVIGSGAYIGRESTIGVGTRIQHGCFLPNKTRVGAGCFIGPNVTMTDDKYPRAGNKDYLAEPPIIEDGASIGAGAVILPGVRIGASAMVGAGAVVTRDVPPGVTYVGMPAREHGNDLKVAMKEERYRQGRG